MSDVLPEYENRPLTETEAQAYQPFLEQMLRNLFIQQMVPLFEVVIVIGEDLKHKNAILITRHDIKAEDSPLLLTPRDVTNFLQFLKMQPMRGDNGE
jgi:hypothetical protein